jgi:RsiW-degrading membrane proteinase PrsW (M82 family)
MSAEVIFFVLATATNIIAAGWIIAASFTDRMQSMPKWHLLGLLTGAAGLMFQAVRNIYFLATGESMADSDLPVWYLKDLGYFIIAAHSIVLVVTGRLALNTKKKPRAHKTASRS